MLRKGSELKNWMIEQPWNNNGSLSMQFLLREFFFSYFLNIFLLFFQNLFFSLNFFCSFFLFFPFFFIYLFFFLNTVFENLVLNIFFFFLFSIFLMFTQKIHLKNCFLTKYIVKIAYSKNNFSTFLPWMNIFENTSVL